MSKLDRRLVGNSYALANALNLVEKPLIIVFFSGDTDEYIKDFMKEKGSETASQILELLQGERNDKDRSARK